METVETMTKMLRNKNGLKVETLKTQTFENNRCLHVNAKNENKFLLNRYLSTYVKTTLTVEASFAIYELFQSNETVFSKRFIYAICHFY